ncbi:hypothetical protein A8C56_10870 [Niabella ginsenosidivorans]|uniref:ROK family protein n=1 Tax=Niabella ginsenosidivorans TaxID=1176587 RepID=A0A1A9I190_9BACT|nr:ROK family protein [Niabella ginsenosidivorans]ANH81418.1 hypothetical protein A8C56_10870 [Niabella ginsenosidivorans]
MTTNNLVLAVDIGGTHITAALVNMDERKIILPSLVRKRVDSGAGAQTVIRTWSACMRAAGEGAVISKICLAMPGPFDYDNGISLMTAQGKYDALYRLNVKHLLAGALEVDPGLFFIRNDAACFLQGEVFAGAVRSGFQKVAGITLGTGLGTAFYENGTARNADLWQLPFLEGIAEEYLSTRWFIQRFRATSGAALKGVKELAALAKTDARVPLLFKEFGKNLGIFLCRFVEMKQAEAIVIGGNIAHAYELFQEELHRVLGSCFLLIPVKRSMLGEQATLYGAAGSWYAQEFAIAR